MFFEAEPFAENSLGEPSVTPSGSNTSAASAAPARDESSAPVVIPVHQSAEAAPGGCQPEEGQDRGGRGGDASPAPAEAAPLQASAPEADASAAEPGSPSAEELSEMMDQFSAPQDAPTEGEIVEGKVIAVSALGVVVDFGRKSEGLVPAEEFIEAEQAIQFGPGQTIEVQIIGEHKDGYAILSHQRVRRRKVWADLEKAYHDKTSIKVKVVGLLQVDPHPA